LKIPIVIGANVLISGYLWNGKPRQAIKIVCNPPYEIFHQKIYPTISSSISPSIRFAFTIKRRKDHICDFLLLLIWLFCVMKWPGEALWNM